MVVSSEVSPCRLDRNAPELWGGRGFGGLTTDPKPGCHIPADSGTLHPLTILRTSNLCSKNVVEIYSYVCVKSRKQDGEFYLFLNLFMTMAPCIIFTSKRRSQVFPIGHRGGGGFTVTWAL